MRRTIMVIGLIVLSMMVLSCNRMPSAAQDRNKKADSQQMQVARKGLSDALPCFKCHSFEKFQQAFPHDMHRSMGLHCTQCHSMRAHRDASISASTCQNCHNLREILLDSSSMPVNFNHSGHMSMFSCKKCHNRVFPMNKKAVRITMKKIRQGRYCGTCHNGQMAFSYQQCSGCHE